jgi:hypothetical protein
MGEFADENNLLRVNSRWHDAPLSRLTFAWFAVRGIV